ncbi:mannitol dehydrogenase family protein [Treponema parvum]|uniref:Mannitol dehydrogenase family protein n=1 Tax=Treponema parvum TaxID=138851 RepID=A0A975F246_9SPIR|nr:mannitol dehydrogenase family protein [Treponema parvum]QTQ12997.1 mannitol dehydrogenase family protein [Treponema parvum]
MELTLKGIKNNGEWQKAEIELPAYDVRKIIEKTIEAPRWVHFGIGNIFRIFIGGIADSLLEQGELDRGLTCVESFDYDIVDKICIPFDNLALSVILNGDGTQDKRVLGSFAEVVKAKSDDKKAWNRLKEIFSSKDLQIISFTITEKGYQLRKTNGDLFKISEDDIANGPEKVIGTMAIVTAMLFERFLKNAAPIALVSMDNCSQNGIKLREPIIEIAYEWFKRGFVTEEFVAYVKDDKKVSFPWTMIDKITPRPSKKVADTLEALGVKNMQPVITLKKTYIAPFVNAENPQYLVVEDNFPNGRPRFETAGIYMVDRDTVNKSERMKVSACLNPIHTALGPYGCMLGYDLFSDEIRDPDMHKLAEIIGYKEGMDVTPDPVVLSPKDFLDECMNNRFPNPYLGDTCLRLCTDVSQGLGVRFGVTINSYVKKYGDAKKLIGIPIAIAGWLRYLLGVDDKGDSYELAPDPMAEECIKRISSIKVGRPETMKDQLKWILSNKNLFLANLYETGIGEKIEEIFKEEISGLGAVRATVRKYLT